MHRPGESARVLQGKWVSCTVNAAETVGINTLPGFTTGIAQHVELDLELVPLGSPMPAGASI